MSKSNKDILNQLKSSLSKAGSSTASSESKPSPTAVQAPVSSPEDTPHPPVHPHSEKSEADLSSQRAVKQPEKGASDVDRPSRTTKPKMAAQEPVKYKSKVISITLYPRDLDRIDEIIDFMRDNQRRITRSDAIKLALRGVPLNKQMADLYPKIQNEDGRRK